MFIFTMAYNEYGLVLAVLNGYRHNDNNNDNKATLAESGVTKGDRLKLTLYVP